MYRLNTRILESLNYRASDYQDVLMSSKYDIKCNAAICYIFETTQNILSVIVISTEVVWILVDALTVSSILLKGNIIYPW